MNNKCQNSLESEIAPDPNLNCKTENTEFNYSSSIRNGLDAQIALDILGRYLLGEDWYIVDPVSNIQGNAIVVDAILKRYSRKYRRELREEKNLADYINKYSAKLERKKNKMKRRRSK